MAKSIKVLILLVYTFLLFVLFSVLSLFPVHNSIGHWDQPDTIAYDSQKYRLFIIEVSSLNPFGLLFSSNDYLIGITRKMDEPAYGHYKKFDLGYGVEGHKQLLEQITIDWREDGVLLIEESGHRVFFPKKSFIGGR